MLSLVSMLTDADNCTFWALRALLAATSSLLIFFMAIAWITITTIEETVTVAKTIPSVIVGMNVPEMFQNVSFVILSLHKT